MDFNYYAISSAINAITCLTIGAFVVSKNPRNPKNLTFFIFCAIVSFYNVFYYLWQTTSSESEALIWCKIFMAFTIFMPPTYFHFVLALTDSIKKHIALLISSYILFFLFFLSDFTPLFISHLEPIMEFKYWPMAGPVFLAFVISFFLPVIYSFWLLINKYRTSKGIIRLQIKYLTIGTLISFIAGSFNYFLWFKIPIPPYPQILISFFTIMTGYAITRYRLMDIRLILSKMIFYFGVSLFAYGIFYLVASSYVFLFGSVFSEKGYWLGLLITPLFAIAIYNGGKSLSRLINKRFFKSIYSAQEAVNQLPYELNQQINLDEIIKIIIRTIEKISQPELSKVILISETEAQSRIDRKAFTEYFSNYKKIIIKDELEGLLEKKSGQNDLKTIKKQMELMKAFMALAITYKEELIGIIFLGLKKDGNPYTQEDIALLETISYQAGTAINNAWLYKKIEEKNKNLQELINVRNDFIRIANHQLNTPLAIMRDAYSMIAEKSLPVKKGISYIGSGLERMSQTIQNLWEAFQLENEEITMRPEKTDIVSAIEKVIAENREYIEDKKTKKIIIDQPDFKIPFVWCDQKKIMLAFSNILNNAFYYTPEGEISVSYGISDDKKYLKIIVKDSGMGINEEEKKKITEKFFRSKRALIAKPDGSGLGLYIANKIIKNSNGKLFFESLGENKGSTFTIQIPVFSG